MPGGTYLENFQNRRIIPYELSLTEHARSVILFMCHHVGGRVIYSLVRLLLVN